MSGKVVGQKATVSSVVVAKCKAHQVSLQYNAAEAIWTCVVDGCNVKRAPKVSMDNGEPELLTGETEIVIIRNNGVDGYFIRHVATNVMIGLSDYMIAPPTFDSTRNPITGRTDQHVTVTLTFDKMTIADTSPHKKEIR